MNKIKYLIFLLSLSYFGYSQDTLKEIKTANYVEPEIMAGCIVPNYPGYPAVHLLKSFYLSLGKFNYNPQNAWSGYYNYPFTGVSVSYTELGNTKVFGEELRIMPYIELNTSNKLQNALIFKLGIGCSYLTKHFNEATNSGNYAIGSGFNFAFQAFLHYNVITGKQSILRIGGGYLHSSNGHTQLPNFGLNTATLSVSYLNFMKPLSNYHLDKFIKPAIDKKKQYFVLLRSGIGMHEFGGTMNPVGGAKRGVFSVAASTGIIFKHNIKVQAGFAYRFYQQFYSYILNHETPQYIEHPVINSSNFYFYAGCEYLLGHAGIDIEGGLNLYKPFFKKYNTLFENNRGFSFMLKKLFNSRLGLKLYLLNTAKQHKNNLFMAAHINANFGEADFSDISLGYIFIIPGK
ncbi:MAG: acyloxyacyl hydrolase [Bacteroidetes bacterium]|nr:acyloxyacyl hydrolase [Bacteroidota bacterium]